MILEEAASSLEENQAMLQNKNERSVIFFVRRNFLSLRNMGNSQSSLENSTNQPPTKKRNLSGGNIRESATMSPSAGENHQTQAAHDDGEENQKPRGKKTLWSINLSQRQLLEIPSDVFTCQQVQLLDISLNSNAPFIYLQICVKYHLKSKN